MTISRNRLTPKRAVGPRTSRPGGVPLVSLVVPVFNEEAAIRPFLARIREVLAPLAGRIEHDIVFINDGSRDATEVVIRTAGLEDPRIGIVSLSRNFGKEAALAAGLDHADGDAVIPIDVDLQDPPELIPEMIRLWQEGVQVVNARRAERGEDGWLKRATAAGFYRAFNLLAERPIPADVGDFRLLDRQVVDILRTLGERARFNKGLFSWVGFETAEVSYARPARTSGKSAWSLWRLWNLALDGIFASSTTPLRIWTYVGLLMALLSFCYSAYILVVTLVAGATTPGYASTVILILTFGGLNLIALGIIGEYVGRIYTEVRQRPLYVVRSAHNCERRG